MELHRSEDIEVKHKSGIPGEAKLPSFPLNTYCKSYDFNLTEQSPITAPDHCKGIAFTLSLSKGYRIPTLPLPSSFLNFYFIFYYPLKKVKTIYLHLQAQMKLING